MNQIICDICGSVYPENEERCPVCNYPRQGDEAQAVAREETVRTKVKGGHFSSKNVKKRKKEQKKAVKVKKVTSDKPLIVVNILLLIAILLVSVYIVQRFWGGRNELSGLVQKEPTVTTTAPEATATTAAPTIPCTRVEMAEPLVDLLEAGEQFQLDVKTMPENTTDIVTYVSSDPTVVTVSETGLVTAVGAGQAQITVTCGNVSASCQVYCWLLEETTQPVETSQPVETTAPQATEPKPTESKPAEKPVLTLDPVDVSCFYAGEPFTIYPRFGGSSVSRSKVKWSTSDPKVATVENGLVTAVGKGTATITAEYEGQQAVCTVRCRFENPESENDRQESEEQQPQEASWKANHSDVSIKVGEPFRLTVKNKDGETADAIWTMSVDGVVSIEGQTVTGRAPGVVTLTTTVEGITMTCIVRVK